MRAAVVRGNRIVDEVRARRDVTVGPSRHATLAAPELAHTRHVLHRGIRGWRLRIDDASTGWIALDGAGDTAPVPFDELRTVTPHHFHHNTLRLRDGARGCIVVDGKTTVLFELLPDGAAAAA